MADRTFRFGVVTVPSGGSAAWSATAHRVEELGYSTLLIPDGLALLAPFPSLALAASATKALRVGTFVLAGPLRPPLSAAWEGHSLSVLTDGRFEFGIGTGNPGAVEAAERFGLPWGSGAQRLAQVGAVIDHLRELDGDQRTPVLVAAGGPKALDLAAEKADIVALAARPLTSRDEVAGMIGRLRSAAGARADDIELALNLFVVGDEVPPPVREFIGVDAAELAAHDSLGLVRGSVSEIADELQRRRDTLGASYITVNMAFVEAFAPVVERLAGR